MSNRYFETVFTPSVQAEQSQHGSRASYARCISKRAEQVGDAVLTEQERAFIATQDTFFLATVTTTGWPYLQHRGGPVGFVKILDAQTIAWADFSGNRQYVSIGNASDNDRVAMIFMDYSAQRRLKIIGRMTAFEIADHPEFRKQIEIADYDATIEHAMKVTVVGFDWNCPQHITPRYTALEVTAAVEPLRHQIAELQRRQDAANTASNGKDSKRSNNDS